MTHSPALAGQLWQEKHQLYVNLLLNLGEVTSIRSQDQLMIQSGCAQS